MSRRQTVLVVEDDVPLRQFYRIVLTRAGFDVREVSDGDAALQSLEDNPSDIVLLDLGLPRIGGRLVREGMAAHVHTRDIPVVIVTGSTKPDVQRLNVTCVLAKPVTEDMLVESMRKCLAGAAGRK